jgi:hypothetical protein
MKEMYKSITDPFHPQTRCPRIRNRKLSEYNFNEREKKYWSLVPDGGLIPG